MCSLTEKNQVLTVRVRIDDEDPFEIEMNPDRLRPTQIDLGEGRTVERVELTVLRLLDPSEPAGFAEILLLPWGLRGAPYPTDPSKIPCTLEPKANNTLLASNTSVLNDHYNGPLSFI